jgi:hypothetical protein
MKRTNICEWRFVVVFIPINIFLNKVVSIIIGLMSKLHRTELNHAWMAALPKQSDPICRQSWLCDERLWLWPCGYTEQAEWRGQLIRT